jgi:hypothetical protein
MGADPIAAGRKGGQSRSAAKIAAAKRNGFQPVKPAPGPPAPPVQNSAPTVPLLFTPRKDEQK